MGLSGALIPAGMRRLVAYLIKNRYVDVLVTTGATLFPISMKLSDATTIWTIQN